MDKMTHVPDARENKPISSNAVLCALLTHGHHYFLAGFGAVGAMVAVDATVAYDATVSIDAMVAFDPIAAADAFTSFAFILATATMMSM